VASGASWPGWRGAQRSTPTPPTTPGQLVRACRERAGLTQAQLALRLGWQQASVSEVEADRRGVTVERLGKIAAALGQPMVITMGKARLEVAEPARAERSE